MSITGILGWFWRLGISFIQFFVNTLTYFFPTFLSSSQYLWDQIYLRSSLLQSIFRFRFGDHSHEIDTASHLCKISNICLDIHTTMTKDGYHLILHHCYHSDVSKSGPPVLLVHGLMQDAESFLCGGSSSIVSNLLHSGYDVWIGNNRGTKYSAGHIYYTREHEEYWNYCIDDLALYDVPTMIDYVLSQTNSKQLAYIGFSQGSTQGFGSLFSRADIHSKISVFIALSPALKSTGLRSYWLQSLLQSFPRIVFQIFGRLDMLPVTEYCRKVFSKSLFARVVRFAMKFLFHWTCENMSPQRQIELFQYCYSPSSVKCVNHWFQIIQHGEFRSYQHYDHEHSHLTLRKANYHLKSINCPVAIFYGGRDTLIVESIHEVLQDVNDSIQYLHCEPSYEHLDLIWADCAPTKIFPKIIRQLDIYHSHSSLS